MTIKEIIEKYFNLIKEKSDLLFEYKMLMREYDKQHDEKNLKRYIHLFAEELRSLGEEYLNIPCATSEDINEIINMNYFDKDLEEVFLDACAHFANRTNIVKIIILTNVTYKDRFYKCGDGLVGKTINIKKEALNYYKNNPIKTDQ